MPHGLIETNLIFSATVLLQPTSESSSTAAASQYATVRDTI